MEEIEASRSQWEDDLVWEFLHVPKPQRGPHNHKASCFQDIKQEWSLGWAIHKDKVVVVKTVRAYPLLLHHHWGGPMEVHPDPRYYC